MRKKSTLFLGCSSKKILLIIFTFCGSKINLLIHKSSISNPQECAIYLLVGLTDWICVGEGCSILNVGRCSLTYDEPNENGIPIDESMNLPDEIQHCTNNNMLRMKGEVNEILQDSITFGSSRAKSTTQLNISTTMQFMMSLKETACLLFETFGSGMPTTVSLLHTIEYLRLEHHYAVSSNYIFGIPLITSQCKCDCPGGDSICPHLSHMNKNCTTGAMCLRTYESAQSNVGCMSTSKLSELCCTIQIDPYKDWNFQAVRLEQPDTFLILRYRIFEHIASTAPSGIRAGRFQRKWRKSNDDTFPIALNNGLAQIELNKEHKIQLLAIGGRPNRQVEPGMYFWQMGTSDGPQLRSGVSLNNDKETDLNKLGWFRREKSQWSVRKSENLVKAQVRICILFLLGFVARNCSRL